MKFSKFIKPVVLILIVTAIAVFFFKGGKPESETSGLVAKVKRDNLVQRVTLTGQVWPAKRLDIKPPYAGYVSKIYVHVGDHLKIGDPIVAFSQSLSKGEVAFPIRAGFEGIVTQLWKAGGEYVLDTGDQNLIVRVEDMSKLSIQATVPEVDIAKIKVGEDVAIKISALPGETFTGKITEIDLSAKDKDKWSSSSTEFQVFASIDQKDARLYSGMSAMMDVTTDKKDGVLILPHENVQEDANGYFVTLTSGDTRRVKVGMQTDEAVEILDGVKEGDKVKSIDFLSLPPMKE